MKCIYCGSSIVNHEDTFICSGCGRVYSDQQLIKIKSQEELRDKQTESLVQDSSAVELGTSVSDAGILDAADDHTEEKAKEELKEGLQRIASNPQGNDQKANLRSDRLGYDFSSFKEPLESGKPKEAMKSMVSEINRQTKHNVLTFGKMFVHYSKQVINNFKQNIKDKKSPAGQTNIKDQK